MENLDLKYICTTLGNLAGIPIRIYKDKELLFYYDLVRLPKDPLCVYYDEVMAIEDHVGYFITTHFNYYGVVNSGNIKLVLGPSRQVAANEQEFKELAFRADVPSIDVEAFVNGMRDLVPMPFESILQILCTLNYIMNGEKLELKDITIYDSEQSNLKELLDRQQANQRMEELSRGDLQEIHNSLSQEQLLMDFVRKGDTAALQEWIASAPAVRAGTIAGDQLRQMKNTLIVSATLVSRAAIRGGMSPDEALSLSDAFIRKCELLNTPEQISNLQYHMVLDYTERVEKIRRGTYPSRLVLDVANYVKHHISEPINTDEMAKELFISRLYLSQKFKEEMGETLTDFILKEKTEEAKRLLRYTDKTATMIGSYLGFSSQSHFTRVFRKYTGLTPAELRKKYE
ncbi:MAG: helix-turn-helix domain-containing protein [Bariatricus sp.]|nr:helix-turn-helix domain-containing protein [Bariatricus sp.]